MEKDNFQGHQFVKLSKSITDNSKLPLAFINKTFKKQIKKEFLIDTTEFKLYRVEVEGTTVIKYGLACDFLLNEKDRKLDIIKYMRVDKEVLDETVEVVEKLLSKVYEAEEKWDG